MKVLNLILAVMFLLFAFVQINDPDPVLWILIYGLMAVACILAAFGYYFPKVLLVMLILYIGYSFVYLSGVLVWMQSNDKAMLFDNIAKMQFPYIEESREYLGLFICVFVLVMHLLTVRRKRRALRA